MRRCVGLGRFVVAALIVVLVGGGAAWGDARQATPPAGTPELIALPGVAGAVLGRGRPAAVPQLELAVGQVTIAPGATIPPHEHPGTQVAVIVAGELAYTVLSGEVALTRGDRPAVGGTPVAADAIVAGQTVVLRMGDSVVEQPGALHTARNAGTEPVVIILSTLFEPGAPRTIFVAATPTG